MERAIAHRFRERRRPGRRHLLSAGIVLLVTSVVGASAGGVPPSALPYEPPAPGSYELPPIDDVREHPLLDTSGRSTGVLRAKGDRLAVVSFVYRHCGEARGCPLSLAVLHELDRRLAEAPDLAGEVALLTISFDPERDTPEQMARWRAAFSPHSDWRFLTARDPQALEPVLEDFGQNAVRLVDDEGDWTGLYRHVLKVFVLDRENRIRNVYSAGFLNPELLLADLRTLLLEH